MPVALLIRLLTRVLAVAGVVFLRRQMRGRVPVPEPYRTPGVGGVPPLRMPRWGRALPDVVQGARLAGVAMATAALGGVALVLLSAGTTLTVLGPRWVGLVLLVLCVLFGAASVREGMWLVRGIAARRRRRRMERLADRASE